MSWIDEWVALWGDTEVPEPYIRWSGISLISAVMSDHVWIEKLPGSKLLPNLYVFLVGPSGSGKDTAIDWAMNMLQCVPGAFEVDVYYGRSTIQHLIDHLTVKSRREGKTHIYLVTPELASGIDAGTQANQFITVMTDLYKHHREWNEGTRTKGGVTLTNTCLSWLAGTTENLLVKSIPRDAIEGGFMARVVCVVVQYDFSKRVHKVQVDPDFKPKFARLHAQLVNISRAVGPMVLSRDADQIDGMWYYGRPAPSDPHLASMWKREQDMIYKLAMVLQMAEDPDDPDGEIGADVFARAQKMIAHVGGGLPALIERASVTTETSGIQVAEQYIKMRGQVSRTQLLRYMTKHGYGASRLDKEILGALIGGDLIEQTMTPSGGTVYRWKGRFGNVQ